MDNDAILSLIASLPRRCIVLFEDIDLMEITQARGKTVLSGNHPARNGVTLPDVLNVIDGAAASVGPILVMTSNRPEKPDPSLLCPHRLDIIISLGCAT